MSLRSHCEVAGERIPIAARTLHAARDASAFAAAGGAGMVIAMAERVRA